ncbi:hypothetical protein H1235_08565 [Pseudoxanthomonas sp. NC8]|nr:hypothetical protein H1235_08565 [Pseudoxanthomonas sp. NC8]
MTALAFLLLWCRPQWLPGDALRTAVLVMVVEFAPSMPTDCSAAWPWPPARAAACACHGCSAWARCMPRSSQPGPAVRQRLTAAGAGMAAAVEGVGAVPAAAPGGAAGIAALGMGHRLAGLPRTRRGDHAGAVAGAGPGPGTGGRSRPAPERGLWLRQPQAVAAFGAAYFAVLALARGFDWRLPGMQIAAGVRGDA